MATNIQMKFFPPITRCFKRHENTRKCQASISIEFFACVSPKYLQRMNLHLFQIFLLLFKRVLLCVNSFNVSSKKYHSNKKNEFFSFQRCKNPKCYCQIQNQNKYDLHLFLPSNISTMPLSGRACRWAGWC